MFLFILLIPNIRTTSSYLDREDKGAFPLQAHPLVLYIRCYSRK